MSGRDKKECEICGRPIEGPIRYRFIDANIKLRVCANCSRFGKEPSGSRKAPSHGGPKFTPTVRKRRPARPRRPRSLDAVELVEEFGNKIRKARESAKYTQDQLASQLNEPVSLIKKIEQEKIHPAIKMIKKIEKALKISLIERAQDQELDFSVISKKKLKDQTLEDIIQYKKKDK